jgi:hypothetical protein
MSAFQISDWNPVDRDFEYGPIAATVAASIERTVPSVSSSTLPNTSTAVIGSHSGEP